MSMELRVVDTRVQIADLLPLDAAGVETWFSLFIGCKCKHEDCIALKAVRNNSHLRAWRRRRCVTDDGHPLRWTGRISPVSVWAQNTWQAEKDARAGDGMARLNYAGDISWVSRAELHRAWKWLAKRAKPGVLYVFSTCRPWQMLHKLGGLGQKAWPKCFGIEASARTEEEAYRAITALRAYPCVFKSLRLQPWHGESPR